MKDSTDERLGQVIDYLQEGAERFGELDTKNQSLETSVRKLERIVIEGNGQPSVVSQLAVLTNQVAALKETRKDKIVLVCAFVSAIAVIIAAIITASKAHL